MKYKKNNSFIQYFNKLHEKIRRRVGMMGRQGGLAQRDSTMTQQVVFLGLTRPVPLGCYSNWVVST